MAIYTATQCQLCGRAHPISLLTHDAEGVSFHESCYRRAYGRLPDPGEAQTDLSLARAEPKWPNSRNIRDHYNHKAWQLMDWVNGTGRQVIEARLAALDRPTATPPASTGPAPAPTD